MYTLLPVFCFIIFASFTAGVKPHGKTKPNPPAVKAIPQVQVDTGKVNIRKFNAGSLTSYSNNPAFDYHVSVTKRGQSWWERFWIWFWDLIARLFGGKQTSGSFPFMKYLFYATVIGLVIFFIIKLIGMDFGNLFNRESKQVEISYNESLENIHQVTFDEEIEKALAQRNYKLAIRLLYLSTLKQLNDARLIQWQTEKTNSAYLNELTDSSQRQSFGILTRQFEYVWYGNFSVDARSFQHINTLFLDFKKMLP
jgi:hypothetical protein